MTQSLAYPLLLQQPLVNPAVYQEGHHLLRSSSRRGGPQPAVSGRQDASHRRPGAGVCAGNWAGAHLQGDWPLKLLAPDSQQLLVGGVQGDGWLPRCLLGLAAAIRRRIAACSPLVPPQPPLLRPGFGACRSHQRQAKVRMSAIHIFVYEDGGQTRASPPYLLTPVVPPPLVAPPLPLELRTLPPTNLPPAAAAAAAAPNPGLLLGLRRRSPLPAAGPPLSFGRSVHLQNRARTRSLAYCCVWGGLRRCSISIRGPHCHTARCI